MSWFNMNNFAKHCLERSGKLKPLLISPELTLGTGLFNPSVFVEDGKIVVNLRHCQYTLYHSELNNYEHMWGPLLYLNPENDITLTTSNYICELNENLSIENVFKVDTSRFDKTPLWQFVGLEDARLVKWDNKYYISGVRRDIDTLGTGRMELSELHYPSTEVVEISRNRIPAPHPDTSYCEKNWVPILDQPYHYLKWSNPVEIVKFDPIEKTCSTVFLGKQDLSLEHDLRGGSQVIPYKKGYLSLHHVTYLYTSEAGRKNATYKHQFVYWDRKWNVIKRSKVFDFMCAKIEFACGMAKYKNDFLITFGFQDNCAYILKVPGNVLEEFIND